MRARDTESIEQRDQIRAQIGNVVRTGRHRRAPVAAQIVAHDAEVTRERGHLGLPDLERAAERAGQHQHRRAVGAVDHVVYRDRRAHVAPSAALVVGCAPPPGSTCVPWRAAWTRSARSMKSCVLPR